ncbi:NACHT domain- and WD repeat-containing protein 1 [Heterocephalus glaber]|uniref:NACHT domain- and WD repeat-containing protein 1 n=1 Tax=Heterocephalus glaber TaxID=10181 RepID=A0AAX6QGY3_HETGA|nr:NACHT domain- and WD repeat-containing protein 1 [Heterocephalus glaber]
MDAEREALLGTACPELLTFCRNQGLPFEAVDLRWGVQDSEAADQLTPDLCLEELQRCQRTSLGPAFVALVGDQYGPCPVPRRIEEKEWEALRAQLSTRPGDLELVAQRFRRDENSVPPSYVLQAAGGGEAPGPEEPTLASVLRAAAQEARGRGLISQEQWQRYHRSVLEWELERGLLSGSPGATVFLREIPELARHLLQDCALPVVDRLPDGLVDTTAQGHLSSLKQRMAQEWPGVLKVHRLPWARDLVNPRNKAHARYLLELGEQFVASAAHQVLQRLRELPPALPSPAWLFQDIRHHLWQGTEATRAFCGRQGLLGRLGQRLRQDDGCPHSPLVLFGPPGIGKTAVLCKLAEQAAGLLGRKTVTVLRLLGTSQGSADARGLLAGLCLQLCLAFGLPAPPPQVLQARTRLAHFFHVLLHTVARRDFESLVILLDAVDDLDPGRRSGAIPWLPLACPPRVHLILSACSGPCGALHAVRATLRDSDAYWEVEPLSEDQAQEMVQLLLAAAGRTLSPAQRNLLWASLPEAGNPGRLQLAFHEAHTWASFSVPVPLATTAEEATHQLCARLELTHSWLLVAHVLGYIEASRHGLAEAELKDVLSLDDEVLQAAYRAWTPPSRELLRFPPLLWVRLRRDLDHCLSRRPMHGTTLLAIAHRQLAQVVRERYLSPPEAAARHSVLADFFAGTWSQGTKKLITLPRVGGPLSLDRKVAPQPLWFSDSVANERKLAELPLHLLHAGRTRELLQDVLGDMSWLSCRLLSGGLDALLDDVDLCVPHVDSPELGLLREALELCRPALELRGTERSVLYVELLARLQAFAASCPVLLGPLSQQAQAWLRACPHPVLVPLAPCLQPPGGPLCTSLTGCHRGVTALAWSPQERLLVVGAQDGMVTVWDVEEARVTHILTGHAGEVTCLAVLAREALAVSASRDRTLCLWHLLSGRERFTLRDTGTPDPQTCRLHLDEAQGVVYAAWSSQISAWNLQTAELLFRILGDVSDPWVYTAVLVSQAQLLTLSKGGAISVRSSATGQLQGTRPLSSTPEETPSCAVLVQKQGRLIAGFSSGSIAVVSPDGDHGDQQLERLPEAVCFLVLAEDESLLAAGFGRCVRTFLADSQAFRQFLATDLEHEDTVETSVFGPQNNLIVTGSRDALVQVWSLSEQGTLLHVLEGVGGPGSLLARAGALVACASQQSSSLRVWDLSSPQRPQPPAPFPDRAGLVALSHHGSFVYFPKVGDKHKVTVWDVAEGEVQDTLDASSEVRCLEVAEGPKLLFAGLSSGAVLVFPLDSRQDVLCVPPPEARKPVVCMALSKLEDRLAIAYDNTVLVLDVEPGDPCPAIEGPAYTFYTQLPETIASVAVLGDHRVLYGMTSGDLFLYACSDSQVFPLEAHSSRVTCVDVSHSEQLAVSGSQEGRLCLWDVGTCACRLELGYTSSYCPGVRCVCFSKDDKYVFSGLQDRSVIVWSAVDGTLLATQFVHAVVTRIIPTSNGFIAPTSHGYILRNRFQCPASRASQQDPLRNFQKAVWRVKWRQREELAAGAPQDSESEAAQGREAKHNKRSQVCRIV